MKKAVLLILSFSLLIIFLVIVLLFFKESPVMEEESTYHIVGISLYSDGNTSRQYFDAQALAVMGTQWEETEGELLASLTSSTKRRSTELLFHQKGTSVQIPDWIQLCVILADEEGSPTSILLGNGRGQQRNFIYDPPVYTLSQGEQLCNQWVSLLQPMLASYADRNTQN